MKFLKEVNFSDLFQRRLLYLNAFVTFLLISLQYGEITILLNYYFQYQPVLNQVVSFLLAGLLVGNLTGKLLFRTGHHRLIYIAAEVILSLILAFFFVKSFIPDLDCRGLLQEAYLSFPSRLVLLSLTPFVLGIKFNYFLKVACGNFIDDRKGLVSFLAFGLLGITSGIVLSVLFRFFMDLSYLALLLIPVLWASLFLIRFSYNTTPQFVRDRDADSDSSEEMIYKRDDPLFTFLNFSYIIIYLFLGYKTIAKQYGNFLFVQVSFILVLIFSLNVGFVIGKFLRTAFWYIYTEMIFPLAFLSFLIALSYRGQDPFYLGILLFAPAMVLFGFSLYHTIRNTMAQYEHKRRFNIIDFSIVILPVPILLALRFIDFTSLWFFVLLYAIMLMNVIIPGIHLMQRKISGIKKGIYFVFSLFFIPCVILMHLYYNIPINNQLYVKHITGFDNLKNINFNNPFLKNSARISLHGFPVFQCRDSSIKNLKRVLFPVLLYAGSRDNGQFLFLDGNQKFYQNPVMGYLKGAIVVDYLSERNVDNNILPVSGRQSYVPEYTHYLKYLLRTNKRFSIITDIPNLYDQRMNDYRFSAEYYGLIKKHLAEKGIFAQVYNLKYLRKDLWDSIHVNLEKSFRKSVGLRFSDLMIILSSDTETALDLEIQNFDYMKNLFKEKSEVLPLFFEENHLYCRAVFTQLKDSPGYTSRGKPYPFYYMHQPRRIEISPQKNEVYCSLHNGLTVMLGSGKAEAALNRKLESSLKRDAKILTLLKQSELAEADSNSEAEAAYLVDLKKKGEYNKDLREYMTRLVDFKMEYYFHNALIMEKEKRWDDVRSMYNAMLIINKNSFDANYRMGLLCLTLQNINESFSYMQQAMKLKKDDPKVQYQMGVLLFSTGKAKEALPYLKRAVELNEKGAQVYLYLGLAQEETGDILEAKKNYENALLKDPSDSTVQSSLDRVKAKIEEDRNRWKVQDPKNENEVEKGEKIPLPISKSVYKNRLSDEEMKSMEKEEKKR